MFVIDTCIEEHELIVSFFFFKFIKPRLLYMYVIDTCTDKHELIVSVYMLIK